ncbi:MAG: hypothetical protein K5657_08255 [Desulfovibrio sp.]|nr:hypothetical protein [Desulfovibrio sp.]
MRTTCFFSTRFLPVLLLPFLLCVFGCAGKAVHIPESKDTTALWERYKALDGEHAPYRLSLSLRLGKSGDTRRVTAFLWGNDTENQRLDVFAGVGTIVAKIASTPDSFLLVAPVDGKAYFHEGTNAPRLNLKMPLPLTLSHLANILCGHYRDVFGSEHGVISDTKDGPAFRLLDSLEGTLALDREGRPTVWNEREEGGKGWRMRLFYGTDNLPSKLDLSNSRGERFLLLVKDRERPSSFAEKELDLSVPKGMPLLPIPAHTAAR